MKTLLHAHPTLKSGLAILMTACLAGSPAFAADYFHLGGAAPDLRFDTAANYSNTNGSPTVATVAPTDGTANLFFYNSLVAGPENRTFELGANTRTYNSLTFGSNAGTTQINRDAAGSNTTHLLGIGAGGITVASGAGPVTFGAGAVNSSTGQRVVVGAYADYTIANNSSSDLTFAREVDGRGGAPFTVTVAGSGSGNTIFKDIRSYDANRDIAITINKTSGTGVVIFDGNNATNGHRSATTVTAGTLLVNGTTRAESAFSVGADGILGGSGTIQGSVAFAAGADFLFDAASTLTINGAVSFGGFGIGNVAGLDSLAAEGIYNLIVGTGAIDFTNVTNLGLANAFDLGGGKSAYFQEGSLQLVVVPEPGSLALLLAFGASFLVIGSRRQARN